MVKVCISKMLHPVYKKILTLTLTSYIFKCWQYWVSFYFNLHNKVLYYELSSHTCAFPGKRKDGVVLPDLWPKTSATECMLVHNSVWLCKVYMRLSVVYDLNNLTDLSWNPPFTSTTSGQDKEGGNSELQRNRVRKEEKQENKTGRHMWSCKEEVHRLTSRNPHRPEHLSKHTRLVRKHT